MYSNKLIACVKAGGKVLREQGENVFLPFGSEYTLWFKNEHTRKVQVNVEIDGTDVLFNKSLIINAGETADLKGFVRDMMGNDNRAFKFITKTKEISDFRGDKIEDGLIKITYQFEREIPSKLDQVIHHHHHHHNHYNNDKFWYHQPYWTSQQFYGNLNDQKIGTAYTPNMTDKMDTIYRGVEPAIAKSANLNNAVFSNSATFGATAMNVSATSVSVDNHIGVACAAVDPGITVEGSNTKQSFQNGYIGALESTKHTMVFQLKGLVETEEIAQPVTVKSKKQCPSCGKKWKSVFEYCPNDGTFLRLPQ